MTSAASPAALAGRVRLGALALLPAPILAGVVLVLVLGAPAWGLVGLGAAGWLVALLLRQPVALLAARRLTREKAADLVGWFSGPAEELVRVLAVLLVVRGVEDALWLSFGWAAAEAILLAVNTFAVAGLLGRDDPRSREARELLAAQGSLAPRNPVWGFLERLSATALHLGFSVALVGAPWLAVVTAPLHSAINMLAVRFAPTRIALTEAALAAAGAAVLLAALALATR
ncbi:MAG: hypothetical protein JWP66_1752 [Naasia sp.]|nr:hypothetical protein [Naasia sp.]